MKVSFKGEHKPLFIDARSGLKSHDLYRKNVSDPSWSPRFTEESRDLWR